MNADLGHIVKSVKLHLNKPKQLVKYDKYDIMDRYCGTEFKSVPDLGFCPTFKQNYQSVAELFAEDHFVHRVAGQAYEMTDIRYIILFGERNKD